MIPIHPGIRQWLELSEMLAVAACTGARRARKAFYRHPAKGYLTRRPGTESPMWNVCATLLRRASRPYGAKARLARYLGIPRQRLNDFLHCRSRLPDAELTLRLLHWLTDLRAGRDVTL
jgi:hypothetical protein